MLKFGLLGGVRIANYAYQGQGAQWVAYNIGDRPQADKIEISFKLYIQSHTQTYRGLIGYCADFQSNATWTDWQVYIQTDDLLYMSMPNSGGTKSNFVLNEPLPTGKWLDVSVTYDVNFPAAEVLVSVSGVGSQYHNFDNYQVQGNANRGNDVRVFGNGVRSWANSLQCYDFNVIVDGENIINIAADEQSGLVSVNTGTGDDGVINDEAIHQIRWVDTGVITEPVTFNGSTVTFNGEGVTYGN